MILIWIFVIFLGVNLLMNSLIISWPLQLLQGIFTGFNVVFILAAIALGSWLIGED